MHVAVCILSRVYGTCMACTQVAGLKLKVAKVEEAGRREGASRAAAGERRQEALEAVRGRATSRP